MVLNDSLFAQIKWFRPPSKIYGELWAMVLPLHLLILGSVSSWQILLFLFWPIWMLRKCPFPPPVKVQIRLCTRQILNRLIPKIEKIFSRIFVVTALKSLTRHHRPETQFTINDSHIRWARGRGPSILLDNTHWAGAGWAQTRVSLPIMWAASATATRLLCFGLSDN